MLTYKATNNQSIYDVCLMTYGSFDYLRKLIEDNPYLTNGVDLGIDNEIPVGREFIWDEALSQDQQVNQTLTNSSIILATKA